MELFDKIRKGIFFMSLCFFCLGQVTAQNVAKIGTDEYATLQAALDAAYNATYATPTDVTIELIANFEEHVLVFQKEYLNLTIDGKNHTLAGQIVVDGVGRSSGTETLDITNINFTLAADQLDGAWKDADAFVCFPSPKTSGKPWYYGNTYSITGKQDHYNYAHHVTVSNCTMDATGGETKFVGVKCPGQGAYDITVNNVTIRNAHSLAQLNSTEGVTITNCTATENMYNGINVVGGGSGSIGNVVISGNTISVYKEYGIRVKGGGNKDITLENDTINAPKAIIFDNDNASTATITGGEYIGTTECLNPGSNTEITITGGTYSNDAITPNIAYGYTLQDNGNNTYSVVKLEVAKIGTITYPSLQDALDSARTMTGDVTIELLKDITGYSIVHQKAGLNLTIEGNDHTVAGQIIVDGDGRASGTETLAIQNIAFNDDGSNFCSGLDGFIMVPSTKTTGTPYYTSKYNYAHNITISNCSFTSTSLSLDVVGIKATSGATCYNLVVNNTTGDNLHSLAQLTATEHAVIDHCSATATGSFVNISGGSAADTISNCTFTGVDPTDGYAVRENGGSSVEVTLINNTFEAKNVLQLGKNGGSNASGHINVESGTYNGILLNDQSAAGTATFSFTGGTFSEDVVLVQSYCAPGYMAVDNDPDDEHCTVYPSYVAAYNANGGTGTMVNDTVLANHPDITVKECGFTKEGYAFVRWNTKADGTGVDFTPGTPLTLTQDTTLYAQWGRVLNATTGNIYDDLQAAIDAANAGDSIVMLTDLTSSAVISVVKNLIINGDHHTITSTATRGLWTDAAGVNLTLRNFNLNGGTSTNRGIQVNDPNVTIIMDSCRIIMQNKNYALLALEYDLGNNPNENLHMTVTNSYIKGLAVLRSFAPGANFTFVNDTLHGVNPYNDCPSSGNNFAVIMLCGDETYGDGLGSENASISIENCVIIAEEQGNCQEVWMGIVDGASHASATIDASTKVIDESSENVQEGIIIEGPGNTITLPLDVSARDSILNNPYLTLTDNGNGTYTVSASIFYYWATDGVYCDFHSPFTKNWLSADESIDLLENVTMTQNVTANIDGNFNLNFKDASNTYTITQGEYHIMLADNATATTDVQASELFASLNGSSIIETDNGDDTYTYSVAPYYTITYYSNNSAADVVTQARPYGETVNLKDYTTFVHADSTIYRWNTQADGNGTNYAFGAAYSEDADIDLYAVWRLNLDMTSIATDVVCYGQNNGTDTVKIIGGEAPYKLVLSGGDLTDNVVVTTDQTTHIFTDLKYSTNEYKVELTDVLTKDTIRKSFIINQPDTLEITALTVPEGKQCPLMGTGHFDVSVTAQGGNVGGYHYTWSGDATDADNDATEVPALADDRDYKYVVDVTVTDSKGCFATATDTIRIAPVIANDGTGHDNTTMTIATINQGILHGCDTIIRDFGTPSFVFTHPDITEGILDTIFNNISTIAPDSVFSVGTTTITWTAVDTCGHSVTAEQDITIYHLPCPKAIDGNSNEYQTVRVGCDCWMAENLRATVYSDGSAREIPNVMQYTAPTRAIDYNGNLYDWNAAMDVPNNSVADIEAAYAAGESVQGACPEGWHVPTEAEVANLMSSVNTEDLMAQGSWIPDNGTNASGFNMLPSGEYNSALDRYERKYVSAYFWIFTPPTAVYHACEFGAACSTIELIPGSLTMGYSIRCVLDE